MVDSVKGFSVLLSVDVVFSFLLHFGLEQASVVKDHSICGLRESHGQFFSGGAVEVTEVEGAALTL